MPGRLIERNHPDAGITSYTYDMAGNVLTTQTANLDAISDYIDYIYDDCRLAQISYPVNPEMNVYYQYGTSNTGNQSGRLIAQQDASGMQTFEYGNMGELIENIHTFVVPGGDAYTFQTKWDYDSWNRVIGIYYPDGEYVSYEYDNGGKLIAMSGLKNSITYDYIDDVRYDKFGSRTRIDYGNGTYSLYSYHPQNRRLTNLQSYEMSTLLMHDLYYYYDDAGNITGQGNYGNYVNGNTGGVYESSYSYDDLYRLSSSAGYFSSYYNGYRQFDLEMSYSPSGNIVSKTQNAQTLINGNQVLISYDNDYYYYGKPHAVSVAGNYAFKWDLNGNMVARGISGGERYQCWDEENRLTAVRDVAELSQLSVYLYDGGGERAWKLTGQEMETKLSGKGVYTNVSFDKTLYSSPLMVVTDKEYSKHYFIEGERVCTKIGGGFWGTAPFMPDGTPVDMLYGTLPEFTYNLSVMTGRHIECTGYAGQWDINPSFAHLLNKTNMPEYNQYFYHSDHLGSASFVTDATGYVDQHIQYLPFGELFISQRNSTFDSRYKFTAKELDNETQYTYFGARYLDSEISIWLSVDPLADEMPSWSPYFYCAGNPVILNDPDGKKPMLFGVLERTGQAKYGTALFDNSIQIGPYTVVPISDNLNSGNIIAYNAIRNFDQGNFNAEYQMAPEDLAYFSDNVSFYDQAAKLVYCNGEPDWNYVMMGHNIADGNFNDAMGNIGQMWNEALKDPGFWFDMGVGIASAVAAGGSRISATSHGKNRIAGANQTRGGVLSVNEIKQTKYMGQKYRQNDGATVYLHEINPGRYNAVVIGEKGLITSMKNFSEKSINRISNNYGWKIE
jgi:RHS repeat-associated protein